MLIFSFLLAALPWFAGATCCLALAPRSRYQNSGTYQPSRVASIPVLTTAGVGGVLGYLLWAYAILGAARLGIALLQPASIALLCLFIALAGRRAFTTLLNGHYPKFSTIERALMLLLLGLFALAVYLQYTPLFGWDGLDSWQLKASRFIENSQEQDFKSLDYWQRHPKTVWLIAAWAGWAGQLTGASFWTAPWILCGVSISLIGAGFVYAQTSNSTLALACAVVLATLPLLENHMVIAGYAEIWLCALLMSGVFISALGQKKSRENMDCNRACASVPVQHYQSARDCLCCLHMGVCSRH